MNYKLIAVIPVAGLAVVGISQLVGEKAVSHGISSESPIVATAPTATFVAAQAPLSNYVAAQDVKAADLPKPQSAKPVVFDPFALKNDHHVWIQAEATYGQSKLGSLSYATRTDDPTTIKNGKVKSPDAKWKGGYRLGIGWKFPNHDKWDLFGRYTYRYGSANGSTSAPSGGGVLPHWATNFAAVSPFYADNARAKWQMHLNMADLELGRYCLVSQWLGLRPFIGLRGGTINQDYRVSYQGGSVAPNDTDRLKLESDFWGVGLRMGLNSLWGLGGGFSLYGNGSASLLSGHFDVHETEKLMKQELRKLNIESNVNNVVMQADVALGLQWDYMFSQDRYHLGFKFGWEFDIHLNQNQLFNFTSTSPGSFHRKDDDLTFHGLTLGFRFDF